MLRPPGTLDPVACYTPLRLQESEVGEPVVEELRSEARGVEQRVHVAVACVRLQPQAPTVAASGTYGCSLRHLQLQPQAPTAAASGTYGCSLRHLQPQRVATPLGLGCGESREASLASRARRAKRGAALPGGRLIAGSGGHAAW